MSSSLFQLFVLLIERLSIFVRKNELERQMIVVEVVDHIPEELLVEISQLLHVHLHVLVLKEYHLNQPV
jgi:hypothetical protein